MSKNKRGSTSRAGITFIILFSPLLFFYLLNIFRMFHSDIRISINILKKPSENPINIFRRQNSANLFVDRIYCLIQVLGLDYISIRIVLDVHERTVIIKYNDIMDWSTEIILKLLTDTL